ncbi:MAG: methyltransferase [Desulfuromonadia bacterium]
MSEREWTVPALLQLSGGYWEIAPLHAAVRLDLLTLIVREGGTTAEECAALTGYSLRGLAALLDALVVMGLLTAEGDRYQPTPFSRRYLCRDSDDYLGYIIAHHHHLVAGWSRLHEAVQTGRPVRENSSHGDDPVAREHFLMGMFNLAMQNAPRVVPLIDMGGRRRLLDLGGGPGTWAIYFCLSNPGLSAVVYDLPTTREFAEKTIDRFGLSGRITFHGGDFLVDPLPDGFDVVWISQVLHSEGEKACRGTLSAVRDLLVPGGELFVQEFLLNDDRKGPLFPALFSLNMLVGTVEGQSYSGREISDMLTEAGFHDIRRLPLDLPNGIGIIRGVKR